MPPELISIFTPKELELLISGLPDVDLDDLQVPYFYVTVAGVHVAGGQPVSLLMGHHSKT